jgi:hypothetical protein
MKILSTPIGVLAHFEKGIPHPLYLKLNDKEPKIEQIVSMAGEKLAGNRMPHFLCQSEIRGDLRPFEITMRYRRSSPQRSSISHSSRQDRS